MDDFNQVKKWIVLTGCPIKTGTTTLQHFGNKMARSKEVLKSDDPVHINKIILPMHEGLLILKIAEIIRLESDGARTAFFTTDGKKYITGRTLATYEDQLIPRSFYRVHHSHLVNMNHISKYIKGEGGQVVMSDHSIVDVSRRKKEGFLRALNG